MKKLLTIVMAISMILGTMSPPVSASTNVTVNYTITQTTAAQGVQDFVTRLYNVCLDRDPDTDGFNNWCNRLSSYEISGSEAAYGFIFSSEFQNKSVTNEQYVELMYNCFFGRASDSEGKAHWLNQMNTGMTKTQLYAGFTNSQEFDNLCTSYNIMRGQFNLTSPDSGYFSNTANRAQIEAFVTRLYSVCLNRDPDTDGLNHWIDILANNEISGTEAAYGFFFSPEYKNKNRSDSDFLDDLYNCFLGRAADADGKNFWMTQLGLSYNGMSADCGVFNGFSQSQEYTNICNSYGIDRGGAIITTERARSGATVTPTPEPTTAPRPVINSYEDELEYARQCGYDLVTIDCGSIDQYTVLIDGSLFNEVDENGIHMEITIPNNQYVITNGRVSWTIYGKYATNANIQYMQDMINDYRVQRGVNALPLCTNQAHIEYFRTRAAELTVFFAHYRPNGEFSRPNVTTATVGLRAYNAFYNSPGHRDKWTATYTTTRTNGEVTSAYISGFIRYRFNYITNEFVGISRGTVQGFIAENWTTPGNLVRYI